MSDAPLNNEKAKKILVERAAQFAIEKAELTQTDYSSLLVFTIGKEQKYAVEFDAIERVIPYQNIRPIPGVNPLFSGLIYHGSEIWPVVNLSTLFNCKEVDTEKNFILLYHGSYRYALAIGAVVEQTMYNKLVDLVLISNEEDFPQPYLLGIYQCDIAVIAISAILDLISKTSVSSTNL